MKLSAQEEYGLRCLLYMARLGGEKNHSIPEISRGEGLSVPNVAKLMRLLRRGGLVASVRGQAGGYRLTRAAEAIPVVEVLDVLGGRFFGNKFCKRHSGLDHVCCHAQDCALRPLWTALQESVDAVLTRITVADLLFPEGTVAAMIANHACADAETSAEPVATA